MSEIVEGVILVFDPTQDISDDTGITEFPFELIESYTSVQDIPQYMFRLERQVLRETQEYRDEEAVRKMNIDMQLTKPEEEQVQAPAVNRQPEAGNSGNRVVQVPASPPMSPVPPVPLMPPMPPMSPMPPLEPLERSNSQPRLETLAETSRVRSMASGMLGGGSRTSLVPEEQNQRGRAPVRSRIKSMFWSRSKTSQT